VNEVFLRVIAQMLMDEKIREGKSEYVEEIREIAEELEPHFDEDYPKKLLRVQHPGEQPWMRLYRKERWQPKTRTATGRVFTTLQKIQQADDFKVQFKEDFKETGIADTNPKGSLKNYLMYDLPLYGSIETFVFSIGLCKYLENPNAAIFIGPDIESWIKEPLNQGALINFEEPFPQIFEEEDILFKDDYTLIVKLDQYKAKDMNGNYMKWDQFLTITEMGLVLTRQIKPYAKDVDPFDQYFIDHDFKACPVVTVGSVIYEVEDGQLVYNSVLTPCLPAWNDALFMNDDFLVNKALHSNPIFWRYKNSPCKTCNGTGMRINKSDNTQSTCNTCNGNGLASEGSPFASIEINLQKKNATNPDVQTPTGAPAGYIQLDIEALKFQKQEIDDDIYRGFQAIGLELLANVPAAQSGIAKQYDRKEINTFFFQVAIHFGYLIEQMSELIFLQRYASEIDNGLINKDQIKANIPTVVIPTDYDIITTQVLSANLAESIKSGFDPIITNGLTRQYTEKVFGENSYQLKLLKVKTIIDPLPYMTSEEKLVLKDSMGCSELDYVTSAYLPAFVNQLLEADMMWLDKDRKVQREDVRKLAQEKLTEIKSSIIPIMPIGG
jgi:hypothetical protein